MTGNRQTTAVGLMLGSVLGFSLLALFVDFSGDWGPVALVTGIWTLSYACVNGGVAHWLSRNDRNQVSSWRLIREIPCWAYTVAFVGTLQWVFFAWSARLTETAVTTMIVECWTVLFLLGRKKFAPGADKQSVSAVDVTLTIAAGVGLGLVIFSNASDLNVSVSLWGPVVAGVALVVAASDAIVNIKIGEVVADRLSPLRSHDIVRNAQLKIRVGVLQDAVARIAASVPLLIGGAFQVGRVGDISVSALTFGVGVGVIHSFAAVFFLAGNHLSHSDLINSIHYGSPVLALLWLWLFTEVTINEPAMFIAGVVVIVCANATIHLPRTNGSP